MGADNGWKQEASTEAWPTRVSGHVQGDDDGGGGPQDGGQDEGDDEAGGRAHLVHTRGLGARRAEDQERGEGRGWYGHRWSNTKQESEKGGGQVDGENASLPSPPTPTCVLSKIKKKCSFLSGVQSAFLCI